MSQVVIVTGGIRGMGFEIAKAFLKQGDHVAAVYRQDDQQAQAAMSAWGANQNAIVIKADITKKTDRKTILDETLQAFGTVDALVNNAAIISRHKFLKVDEAEYDEVMDTLLKAPFFLSQSVANYLLENKKPGSIVNISSNAGHRVTSENTYDIAKCGIHMLTRIMAKHLAKDGIRVNTVTPGFHKTDMNRSIWQDQPDRCKAYEAKIPMQRAAEAHEIVGAVMYLTSKAASYTTGTDIVVDGGMIL